MNKTINNKITIVAIALFALMSGLLLWNQIKTETDQVLGRNLLGRTCSTNSSASTSPASLGTPGSATSTVDCPVFGSKSLRVNAWLIASSTGSVYRTIVSFSNDGTDFYQVSGELSSSATTTNLVDFKEVTYKFASTSRETQLNVNFSGTGTTSAKLVSFEITNEGANWVRLATYLVESDVNSFSTSSDSGMIWLEGVASNK